MGIGPSARREAVTEYTPIRSWPVGPAEAVEAVAASVWDDAAVRARIEAVPLGDLDVATECHEPMLFPIVRRGSPDTVAAALRCSLPASMRYVSDAGASAVAVAVWRNDAVVLRAVLAKRGAGGWRMGGPGGGAGKRTLHLPPAYVTQLFCGSPNQRQHRVAATAAHGCRAWRAGAQGMGSNAAGVRLRQLRRAGVGGGGGGRHLFTTSAPLR
jgi:hypothetical protein